MADTGTYTVTPGNGQDRDQVGTLSTTVQDMTGQHIELTSFAAKAHGTHQEVVRLPEATQGFILLRHRWVMERSFDEVQGGPGSLCRLQVFIAKTKQFR
jgi:hypothetical protein